jgi:hypothetical protein
MKVRDFAGPNETPVREIRRSGALLQRISRWVPLNKLEIADTVVLCLINEGTS